MSKPNLIAFSSSVGIFNNNRMLRFRSFLLKKCPGKIDFAELYVSVFQMVMAYAAVNQIDGNFDDYEPDEWERLFRNQNIPAPFEKKWALFLEGMREVGLFDGDKIRSWMKYNRHLADYEGIVKLKRKAAKIMHKKREQEARAALKNGSHLPPESEEKPAKNGSQKPSPSKQLWLIEKALESATGKRKKELQQQKRELLSQATGVDLSEPSPAPPAPAPKHRKSDPAAAEWSYLVAAREMLQDSPDLLSAGMVKALLKAGDKLPDLVAQKFSKLIGELGETRNPVPE